MLEAIFKLRTCTQFDPKDFYYRLNLLIKTLFYYLRACHLTDRIKSLHSYRPFEKS